MTFTVGVGQKENIDAAVKKVCLICLCVYISSPVVPFFVLMVIVACLSFCSFQKISLFFCSTMMERRVSGMSLSGPKGPSM